MLVKEMQTKGRKKVWQAGAGSAEAVQRHGRCGMVQVWQRGKVNPDPLILIQSQIPGFEGGGRG